MTKEKKELENQKEESCETSVVAKKRDLEKGRLVSKNPLDYLGIWDGDWFPNAIIPFRSEWMSSIEKLPKADLVDLGDHYKLSLDLPGFNKDEIEIAVEPNQLTIKAEKTEKTEDENHIIRERKDRSFYRSFKFQDISTEDVDAKLENGVLEITIKKAEKLAPNLVKIK